MSAINIIEVNNLTKKYKIAEPGDGLKNKIIRFFKPKYREHIALKNVSFNIKEGEVIGYLGPNGAGKSTTIKLLTGVLVPTSGDVIVNGLSPYKKRTKNAYSIGVVYGQRSQLWWDLPLIDSFKILAAMYHLPKNEYERNLNELVSILQIEPFLEQPVRKLSLGQRMRGDIAASLLHNPPILYLDEPTIGLDIVSKNRILEFIRLINAERKTTVVFTTHNLSDIEKICNRIMIINEGEVILDNMKGEILNKFGNIKTLVIKFNREIKDFNIDEGRVIKTDSNRVWIEFDSENISAFELIRSLENGNGVVDVSIEENNIESIITDIYENAAKGIVYAEAKV